MDSDGRFYEIAQNLCHQKGFVLEEAVGGGAFKKVFRVNTKDGCTRALKLIKGTLQDDRTDREIRALRKCDHPSIAKLYDVGTFPYKESIYQFTLEEYIGGGTLTKRLSGGNCDLFSINELGRHLIDAIAHLEKIDLVHRDIKPDNIMFRDDGPAPVLVDFNLVRDLMDVSLTNSWQPRGPGTPYFAAPEQLNNQKHLIDWRTDQFSLGVVLCIAFTGMHPYQNNSEPLYCRDTVNRTASRGSKNKVISNRLIQEGLPCVPKMVRAWPVERYRRPIDLQADWARQGKR
jgi:serine/threonine protein kinase